MATKNTGTTTTGKKPLICVFGATGNQGCSVIEALLKDGNYWVRAVTRDKNGEDAKKLKQKNCEVVECDYTGSQEKITECMKGCYGCYLVTNFNDPKQGRKEMELGKKLVDAAKAAGIKHVIWSTLPNVEKLSNGKYDVPHFTLKAKVEEYLRELQGNGKKTFEYCTFIAPAFYYQNFENFWPPKKEGDTWVFTLPQVPQLIAFDVDEVGPSVCTAFNNPDKWNMKRIDFCGDRGSTEDYVRTYGKVTGRKTRLNAISIEEMKKNSKEMGEMFGWFKEYTLYGPDCDPKSGQECTPGGLSTWEQYLTRTWKNKQSTTE